MALMTGGAPIRGEQYGTAMNKETEIALKNYDYLVRSKGLDEVALHWDINTIVWGEGGSLLDETLLTPGFTPATAGM